LPVSVQNAHSASGTTTSAFGYIAVLCPVSSPLMWSPWKWLMTTCVTRAGSMPTARRFSPSLPTVGTGWAPLPVSNNTIRWRPVSTRVAVKMLV
jgi:hypothetical protein